MSATVRKINEWFKNANRYDVNELLEKIILSERQELLEAVGDV